MTSFVCQIVGHKINRHRVWFDSIDHRTSCERCGGPMIRDDAGWRAFDSDRDSHPLRRGHPNYQDVG